MSVIVVCPSCKSKCQITDQYLGKTIRCGSCKSTFTAANPLPNQSNPKSEEKSTVICPMCNGKNAVANQYLGKYLRCVSCKGVFPTISDTLPAAIIHPSPAAPKKPGPYQSVQPVEKPLPSAVPNIQPASNPNPLSLNLKKPGGFPLPLLIGAMALAMVLLVGGAIAVVLTFDLLGSSNPTVSRKPQRAEVNKEPGAKRKERKKDALPAKKKIANPPQKKIEPPKKVEVPAKVKELPKAISRRNMEKVKDATVYMRVTLPNGKIAEGSGFFGQEPGLLITNAHVLGMLRDWNRKPQKIAAYYHRGRKDEKVYQAKIIGLDRDSDLAVLKVDDPNLPSPLRVNRSEDLYETQTVYVVGYPLGDQLGKEVTINTTGISSLRDPDQDGVLDRVQVNKAMDPGNSGGPVVNTAGEVIGVSVAIIKGTNISFAIAGDKVHGTLHGRVADVVLFARKEKGMIHLDVDAELVDPLKRVTACSIDFWLGKETDDPDLKVLPIKRNTLTLDPRSGSPGGKIKLPQPGADQVIWYQPILQTGANQTFRQTAKAYKPEYDADNIAALPKIPGLMAKPARLSLRYSNKSRYLKLGSRQNIKLIIPGLESDQFYINMAATMLERPLRYNPDTGIADILLEYKKYQIGIPTQYLRQNPGVNSRLKHHVQHEGHLAANISVDRTGKLVRNDGNVRRAPFFAQEDLKNLHSQIRDSLHALEVPFPGRVVQPNESWRAVRRVHLPGRKDQEIPAALRLTYRYLGVRKRDERTEAVIHVHGNVINRGNSSTKIGGKASGLAYFDLEKGQFIEAEVTVTTELEGKAKNGRIAKVNLVLVSKLERIYSDIAPNMPTEIPGATYVLKKSGNLRSGFRDNHNISLTAGKTYTIEANSRFFDTFLELYNPAGARVAFNDDISLPNKNLNSRIVFQAPQNGQYRLLVRSFQNRGGGAYRIVVRQDPSGPMVMLKELHRTLQLGSSSTNRVELKKGVAYKVEVNSPDFDPVLLVKDSGGQVLDMDNDSGNGPSPLLYIAVPRSGSYQLVVTGVNRSHNGRYWLKVYQPKE